MDGTSWAFQQLGDMIAVGLAVAAYGGAALGLSWIAVLVAIRCIRRPPPEVLFAGRWSERGPELFLVSKGVRRLHVESHPAALAFARAILAEVMRCRPATGLARTFAEAELVPLRDDGFVLSTADVEAWLDGREPSPW